MAPRTFLFATLLGLALGANAATVQVVEFYLQREPGPLLHQLAQALQAAALVLGATNGR